MDNINYPTNDQTNCIEQSPSWEANSLWASQ
jgi:hypothetical protein